MHWPREKALDGCVNAEVEEKDGGHFSEADFENEICGWGGWVLISEREQGVCPRAYFQHLGIGGGEEVAKNGGRGIGEGP